jgi:NCAIR mutase (PurE)-related protein
MSSNNISDLIQRLRAIRLQEAEVLNAIEAELALDVHTLVQRPSTITSSSTVHPSTSTYVPGDRVIILNKINKQTKTGKVNSTASTTSVPNQERLATVVSVAGDRIHLLTDTGVSTWLILKNLAHVDSSR